MTPGLSLDRIGQALASFYDDLIAEGVPEHLAGLVRQVRQPDPDPIVAPRKPATTAPKSGRLALVVEDDAATRALAEMLLEETELGVLGCDSAESALTLMREHSGEVALVFADVRLAGAMDGLQLAAAIALLWPTVRVVVTSGRRAERPATLSPQAVFIPKPWRPFDLLVEAERATTETQPIVL
ncbi:response regulator [Methylobacterium sp. BTF04]|nr:response regulator [Methylobacterium sp. BTF04]